MNRSELESKHLAELHSLAAEAGIERYRMLPRGELIAKLSGGEAGGGAGAGGGEPGGGSRERRSGSRERRPGGREGRPRRGGGGGQERGAERQDAAPEREEPRATAPREGGEPGRRRRRRRRFGRRRKELHARDLLLPAAPGRQALVYGESRAACTALLRDIAAELSGGRGPDPVALLVDPSPEELADWKREAPKAEIVSAGQERHAQDALAQAARRAESGEAVVFLVDSLSRAAEEFGGAKIAQELFDGGQQAGGAGGGSLTIVAAIERPAG